MLFCEDRTATPLPTQSEQSTSKTLGSLPCFSSKEMITLMCSSCENTKVHCNSKYTRRTRLTRLLAYSHHVQGFRRVDENAVKHVQHPGALAGSLRTQPAEQPVQTIAVGELRAIRVIPFDDCCQQLIQVSRYLVPGLTALVPGKCHEETLRRDHVDLVDGLEDQVQYALLLEQVLTISQRSESVLLLFVLCGKIIVSIVSPLQRQTMPARLITLTHVVFGLSKVINQVFQTHHHFVQIHILEEHRRPSVYLQRL